MEVLDFEIFSLFILFSPYMYMRSFHLHILTRLIAFNIERLILYTNMPSVLLADLAACPHF